MGKTFEISWKFKRSFGLISDTHTGSDYGLWPPNFITDKDKPLPQSQGQKEIWKKFTLLKQKFDEFKVEKIIHAGDSMHGQNHMERGIRLMTADMDEQEQANKMCLEFIADGRPIHMVGGSGYHQGGKGHFPEKNVVERIGGTYEGPLADFKVKGTNRRIAVQHGESGAFVYRETMMARELLFQSEAESLGLIDGHIDVKIQGHWHFPSYIHKYRQHWIQLPCWQAWPGHKIVRKSWAKMQPIIGGAVLLIDEEDRIRHIPFNWLPPKMVDFQRPL